MPRRFVSRRNRIPPLQSLRKIKRVTCRDDSDESDEQAASGSPSKRQRFVGRQTFGNDESGRAVDDDDNDADLQYQHGLESIEPKEFTRAPCDEPESEAEDQGIISRSIYWYKWLN